MANGRAGVYVCRTYVEATTGDTAEGSRGQLRWTCTGLRHAHPKGRTRHKQGLTIQHMVPAATDLQPG
jgi:hypothetical protein